MATKAVRRGKLIYTSNITKIYYAGRAQGLNLSLGALVLPDVNV